MSTQRHTPRIAAWLALACAALATAGLPVAAVRAQAAAETASAPLSADELDDLVGRIALYPDDLIGIVLPASTYPLQVVQAGRFLEQREKNPDLKPDDRWDDSVVALLNYPEVVKLMNDDLDWTSDLGEAVANQRPEVLDAIQNFRDRAYAAGNLKTDDRQIVKRDDDEISIAPANPEVIYVPYYEPDSVVVDQPRPVYYYYPIGYPVYFYPYPIDYRFQTGFFWGVTTAFTIGWHNHVVNVERYGHFGHPYYGRTYYDPFYVRNNTHINVNIVNRGGRAVWEPRYRHPSRPIVVGSDHRAPSAAPQRGAREGSADRAGSYRSGSGVDTRHTDPRSTARTPSQPLGGNAANAAERARRAGQQPAGQTAAPAAPQAAPQANGQRYIQPRTADPAAGQTRGGARTGEDAASKRGGPPPQQRATTQQSDAPSAGRDFAPRPDRGLGRPPQQTAPHVDARQFVAPPQRSAPPPPPPSSANREYRVERAPGAANRAPSAPPPAQAQSSGGAARQASPPPQAAAPESGGGRGAAASGGASHREALRGGGRGNGRDR